jgi:hypothetical protein
MPKLFEDDRLQPRTTRRQPGASLGRSAKPSAEYEGRMVRFSAFRARRKRRRTGAPRCRAASRGNAVDPRRWGLGPVWVDAARVVDAALLRPRASINVHGRPLAFIWVLKTGTALPSSQGTSRVAASRALRLLGVRRGGLIPHDDRQVGIHRSLTPRCRARTQTVDGNRSGRRNPAPNRVAPALEDVAPTKSRW